MSRHCIKLIKENDLVAEVDVELIESDHPWSPCLSLADAKKLDTVRLALKQGDLSKANQLAKVYRLTPVGNAA